MFKYHVDTKVINKREVALVCTKEIRGDEMKLAHMYHSSHMDSITYVMLPLICCVRNAGLRAFTSWIRTFRTL